MQFTKDSVVCFVGDSIVAAGCWQRRVYEYYRQAGIPCRMYNCGVGGDTANRGMYRLEETVFIYKPTDVVVSFGMNDCGYYSYGEEPLSDTQVMNRRRWLDTSIASIRAIAGRCAARGIRVTLCTPTLPNELMDCGTPDYMGAAASLVELSLRIRALARELGLDVIHFTMPFRKMTLELWKQGRSLVCADRVHPVPEGYEFMAKVFLREQGFPVELPETWEELEALAQLPHDAWEEKRYQLEQETNCNMRTEWDFGYGKKSREAMEAAIARQLPLEQRPHILQRFQSYSANLEKIPASRAALIAHTETVGK